MTGFKRPGEVPGVSTLASRQELTAVVTRADGTVERMSLAYWDTNPLRRAWWNLKETLGLNRRIVR